MGRCVAWISLLVAGRASGLNLRLTHVSRTEMAVSWNELLNSSAWIEAPPTTVSVTWGTDKTKLDTKAAGASSLLHSRTENMEKFDYCGGKETHRLAVVRLPGLPAGATVYYAAVECDAASKCVTSPVHNFTMEKADGDDALRFVAFGDVGDPVSHSWTAIPAMNAFCAPGAAGEDVSLGLHVGDIAYNLDIPPLGDNYEGGIEPMAGRFPWMVAPGNHESDCNYTYHTYNGRFAAQNLTEAVVPSGVSRWYSFDKGPVHFVALDTDAWGFDEVADLLAPQYAWLVEDLAAVDRTKTPWIVLYGHRPMYCTAADGLTSPRLGWPKQPDGIFAAEREIPRNFGAGFDALGLVAPPWEGPVGTEYPCGIGAILRNGVPSKDGPNKYALEPLMAQYEIDLYLTGHEHNYERIWPILNGSFVETYDKPKKPVHVLTGAGGAYGKDAFGAAAPFDVTRSSAWSFSDITVNRTHLVFAQRDATNAATIDAFTLVR